MIPQYIKDELGNYIVPKKVKMEIGEEIILISPNTNVYTIALYIILIGLLVFVTAVTHVAEVLMATIPFLLLIHLNLKSKSIVKLSAKGLYFQSGYSLGESFSLDNVEKVKFEGLNLKNKSSLVCMRLFTYSGEKHNLLTMAANQKFIYYCVDYFLEEMRKSKK